MTKTTMTYDLPDEPEGAVWDSHGRTWHNRTGLGWLCADSDLLPQTWRRLVVLYGPLTDAPKPANNTTR